MRPRDSILLLLALASSASLSLGAADWPQWRGPARDGVAPLPAVAAWPKALRRAWRATVGEGHSSPVVAGDRAFVFARQGDIEELLSFDLGSGRLLWRQGAPAPYPMNPAATGHGK